MPGHIGTDINANLSKILGFHSIEEMTAEEMAMVRERLEKAGISTEGISDDEGRAMMIKERDDFKNNAPLTADQAAAIILDGVRNEKWRILVGYDAAFLEQVVRENPETAYDISFMDVLEAELEKRGDDSILAHFRESKEQTE